jgi:hypothetical protein
LVGLRNVRAHAVEQRLPPGDPGPAFEARKVDAGSCGQEGDIFACLDI